MEEVRQMNANERNGDDENGEGDWEENTLNYVLKALISFLSEARAHKLYLIKLHLRVTHGAQLLFER